MPTITTVDASWVNAVANDDAELRRFDTTMFLGDGSNNGVRGGIVRHGDTSLGVTVNGSDQVTVQAGAWVIPAATGLGVYRGALSAATAATALAARNATNPRIDLIVVQAPGIVKTIEGTPGASPTAPALPAQHIELARVTVPAVGGGAVTVDSTWRAYAASLGGTLYVETPARLPGSGNQKGQRAVALSDGTEHIWNGTAWAPTGSVTNTACTLAGANTGSATVFRRQNVAILTISITVAAGASAFQALATLPAGQFAAGDTIVWNNNTNAGVGVYVDAADGTLRTRVNIAAGHLLLGQLVMAL